MKNKVSYTGKEEWIVSNKKKTNVFLDKFNNIPYNDDEARYKLCFSHFGKVGKNLIIKKTFSCDLGFNIFVGDDVFINYNCVFLDMAKIIIGNRVLIGPNVLLCTATHSSESKDRSSGSGFAIEIVIEDDAWIGAGAIVLPGVTIGRGAVVAAGAIVTKDVKPFSVVAGNPAKELKNKNE